MRFILRVEEFYAGARYVDKQPVNHNALSNQIRLPNAEADLEMYFDTETGMIRPQFAWYIEFMRTFPNSIDNLNEGAGEILTALEDKMDDEQLQDIQVDESTQP